MNPFWQGVASILDLFGVMHSPKPQITREELAETLNHGFEKDTEALRGDWERAIQQVEKEIE